MGRMYMPSGIMMIPKPEGETGDCKSGAAGGDRTHDPWLRRPILYPLSYSRFGTNVEEG